MAGLVISRSTAAVAVAALAAVAAASSPHGGVAPASARPAEPLRTLIESGYPVRCGGGRERYVALTFDDGPGPYTARLLTILRRHRARATFFLVGDRLARWGRLAVRARSVGELGDHSWAHSLLPRLTYGAAKWEILWTRREILRRTGVRVTLFRPPYGSMTRRLERLVRQERMLDVLWNVDSLDYAPGASTSSVIANVVASLRPGAIVLMHDIHPWTVAAVPRLLTELRRRRLRPVTVSKLLTLDPPTRAQLRRGAAGCRRAPGAR